MAAAIRHVLELRDQGLSWADARDRIGDAYGHYAWVHTINNAAIVVLGLLWSDGDFTTAVGNTVMAGLDTDSNGATVGSVAGILAGTSGLPRNLIEPLHNRTRSALLVSITRRSPTWPTELLLLPFAVSVREGPSRETCAVARNSHRR